MNEKFLVEKNMGVALHFVADNLKKSDHNSKPI